MLGALQLLQPALAAFSGAEARARLLRDVTRLCAAAATDTDTDTDAATDADADATATGQSRDSDPCPQISVGLDLYFKAKIVFGAVGDSGRGCDAGDGRGAVPEMYTTKSLKLIHDDSFHVIYILFCVFLLSPCGHCVLRSAWHTARRAVCTRCS